MIPRLPRHDSGKPAGAGLPFGWEVGGPWRFPESRDGAPVTCSDHHHRMVSRLGSPRFDAGMVPRFLTILTGKPADNPAAAGA